LGVLVLSNVAGCGPKEPAAAPKVESFGGMLAKYGFVELRPPSTLVPPGTIVRVKNADPLQAGIVCTQKSALGADVPLQESSSQEIVADDRDGASYYLDGSNLPILSVDARYASVERLKMSLTNVRVLEIADEAVYERFKQRSAGCQNAVAGLLQSPGSNVSMIKSVLMADVTYSAEFKRDQKLDAAVKVSLLKDIAPALGANSETATETGVSGKALYWGVIDDVRLAQAGLELPSDTRAAEGERVLKPSATALELDATPEAE
jgi:hypothetical protein